MKKQIFKKWWFWLIVGLIVLIFVFAAIGADIDETTDENTTISTAETTDENTTTSTTETITEKQTTTETSAVKESNTKYDASTEEGKIETVISNRIVEKYTYTNIDEITINDDLGTDKEGDYIALVYLTWEQKNSGKTSKEVLTMYSNDLAATVAKENSNVQEIAIFWTVPYLNNATAKCSYERKNGEMFETDIVWDGNFS